MQADANVVSCNRRKLLAYYSEILREGRGGGRKKGGERRGGDGVMERGKMMRWMRKMKGKLGRSLKA